MWRCVLLAVSLASPVAASATEIGSVRPFGLGIVLGDPTGLSGKYYFDRSHALDGALAWRTWWGTGVYAHATYLWHPSVLLDTGGVQIPWNVGVGGFLGVWDRYPGWWRDDWPRRRGDPYVGVRVPVGLDVDLKDIPLQFFGNVALGVLLLPGVDIDVSLGLGARYYF